MERGIEVRFDLYAHRQGNPGLLLPVEGWTALLSAGEYDDTDLLLQIEGIITKL